MKSISLMEAFDLPPVCRVAVVGAGGKTSLVFRLARACARPVIVSNTAHLAVDQGKFADRVITVSQEEDFVEALHEPVEGVTLITGPADQRGRTAGLQGKTLERLDELADRWHAPLLIEADGSRGLPLKAPAPWEPPIPDFVDAVIVTAGLSAIGKPLTSEWVYRPEDFAALTGLSPGAPIDVGALVSALSHANGGQKNIPEKAARAVLLNQADTQALREVGASAAERLLDVYHRVVVASLHGPDGHGPAAQIHAVHQKIGGIVLAAGAASRMGQPKQLLEWQGEPLVRRQARMALAAGLDPVVVVIGAYGDEVNAAFNDLRIRIVNNREWQTGQSSSVRTGISALPGNIGGAVFLLADQPFISDDVIRQLTQYHTHSLASIIAPVVGGQRANPVLFDRRTFNDLAGLQGDAGGRQVMSKWGVDTVEWEDERLLVDVDSLDDYQRAVGLA